MQPFQATLVLITISGDDVTKCPLPIFHSHMGELSLGTIPPGRVLCYARSNSVQEIAVLGIYCESQHLPKLIFTPERLKLALLLTTSRSGLLMRGLASSPIKNWWWEWTGNEASKRRVSCNTSFEYNIAKAFQPNIQNLQFLRDDAWWWGLHRNWTYH